MAHQYLPEEDDPLPQNPTAVAIDKDKHSQYAVKWAIDHLLTGDLFLILIHVNHRGSHNNADVQQLFIPFHGYCARKSVQVREVVLEDADVSKALLEYINRQFVANIVLGSAARSFIKNFKKLDVPNAVSKSAPEFCSVYVVQKGKLMSAKAAQRPIINSVTPPKLHHALSHQVSLGNADQGNRTSPPHVSLNAFGSEKYMLENNSRRRRNSTRKNSMDGSEFTFKSRSLSDRSSPTDEDQEDPLGFPSIDMTHHNMDFSMPVARRDEYGRGPAAMDVEEEMRKLKLELNQTLEMYNTACKEAILAKQKVKVMRLGERPKEIDGSKPPFKYRN